MDKYLLEATVEDLRAGFNSMLERDANQTVRLRQAAVRKFYRYHDTGVTPEEIPLVKVNKTSNVDERTTLTRDDVQVIREACDNLRDRAMLEMFVYTGLRLRAVQRCRCRRWSPGVMALRLGSGGGVRAGQNPLTRVSPDHPFRDGGYPPLDGEGPVFSGYAGGLGRIRPCQKLFRFLMGGNPPLQLPSRHYSDCIVLLNAVVDIIADSDVVDILPIGQLIPFPPRIQE